MTKTELEKLRKVLEVPSECTACHSCAGHVRTALQILDAELAKPEAREWRVLAEDHSQCFWSEAEANAAADWLRTNDSGNVYVDSRTVGPWERAE